MKGKVTINGVEYAVSINDLTPADVLPVFRTDTSILRTDSILLHSAGTEQNSAKKVLIPHMISLMSSAIADDVALTILPYYDDNGVYRGMYWHYNGSWLRRSDTGEMIRVDDTAAEIALSADLAVKAAKDATDSAETARKTERYVAGNEEARVAAEVIRKTNEQTRQAAETKREQQATQDHTRAEQDHTTAATDHSTARGDHSTATQDHTRAEQDHATAATDHSTATQDHTRAESDHTRAEQDHTTAATDHSTAQSDHTRAEQDHTASEAATAGASRVNATLDGLTVTITDRNGDSRSQDIGFEMFKTYPSEAAMKADAANVPQGKFVIIATADPTSEENARLYCRNAQAANSPTPFTFLSDLDQAATSAFADWMENYKPVIEADHTRAEQDHAAAASDHETAGKDHQQMADDHQTFVTNEAQRQEDFDTNEKDRQDKFDTNEAQRQEDFENAEADRMAAMTVTKCFVDLTTMCLMFVQPASDSTQYQVRNGDLNITVRYEI